jgi:crossover junction endodeoxyribonuclease RuvC
LLKILGVDPGLTKTGLGIIGVKNNSLIFIASKTIYTTTSQSLAERLKDFHHQLSDFISEFKPDVAAIEETFVNNNPVSSLKLGHARGSLILTLAIANLEVFEYSSTSIKKTVVGVGRADKNQIQQMIKILLPKADFKSEDEADALAIAICHNNQFKNF